MAYTAEISRTNPTCFLFLVDQSSSMLEPFGKQPEKQKAEGVADAINRLFQNLVLKCAKSEGIRDYFYVGAIVYGGQVASAFGGALAGQHLVPVSTLANSPLRVEPRTRMIAPAPTDPQIAARESLAHEARFQDQRMRACVARLHIDLDPMQLQRAERVFERKRKAAMKKCKKKYKH